MAQGRTVRHCRGRHGTCDQVLVAFHSRRPPRIETPLVPAIPLPYPRPPDQPLTVTANASDWNTVVGIFLFDWSGKS